MGRRGPKPKSPTLKILEGNPGRRKIASETPRATGRVPRCPSRYTGTPSRVVWQSLGRRLAAAGILTHLDTFALELLVDSVLAYERATKKCDEKLLDATYKQLRQMLREFGLTPASRSSVKVAEPPQKAKDIPPAAKYFA